LKEVWEAPSIPADQKKEKGTENMLDGDRRPRSGTSHEVRKLDRIAIDNRRIKNPGCDRKTVSRARS
jgi:hypothetical protein